MIIKILTGLEKRVEDIGEILHRDKKKKQSEMKNTVCEIKNTLDGMNSRLREAEEWINVLEDTAVETNQAERVRENIIMQNENRLRELDDFLKCSNIHFRGIPEEEREKVAEILLEKIIADNLPNLGKETDIQIKEAQRSPNKINPSRSIPRHLVTKMAKSSDKGKKLKVVRERKQLIQGKP